MDFKALIAAPLVAFLVVASANEVTMPQFWSASVSGTPGKTVQIGVDPQVTFNGQRALTVNAVSGKGEVTYGSAIQYVRSFGYEGKRVRFSGMLKVKGVQTWGGIWLGNGYLERFDDEKQSLPKGTDMGRGDHDWKRVSVVMDVPTDEKVGISMGLAVVGQGQVWLSDLKFEEVDSNVPVTTTSVGLDLDKLKDLKASLEKAKGPPNRKVPQNLELAL